MGASFSVDDIAYLFAPRKEEEMNYLHNQKSHEFDAFLRGPSLRGLSSSGLGWKGALIEEHTKEAGEYPQTISEPHIICMSCGPRSTSKYPNYKDVYIPNTKYHRPFTFTS